ncbi:MAG: outer membrane beta-barrel protein [Bacteroidaceae bacterium]|nr:outer membrane beta-barrel protein [Bacteroidaceae bacterium]
MKKNIFNTIIIALTFSSSQTICAQQNTIAMQRRVVDEAISTIEDYETYATISDDEIRYSFVDLFVSEDAPVYNDLLGLSDRSTLTAREYSQLLGEGPRNKNALISNLKKERVWNDDGTWRALFSFEKTLAYSDKCGVFFSSKEFYDQVYHLEATLVYNEHLNKCKIEEIKGTVDSNRKLPESYFVFQSEDERDARLSYNGSRLALNSHGQTFLAGKLDKKLFKYVDADAKVTPIVDDCNKVSMKYRPRKTRLKFHYDLGLGDAYKLDGADNALKAEKNASNSFGVDFGYVLPSNGIVKTGLFIGVGFAQSQLDFEYAHADYAYTTTADVDGDSYTRHYQNLSVKQSIKMTDLTIPLYAEFNFQFSKVVHLFIDLGAKFNMNMGYKVDATEGSAYIYGMYPQYANLRMDEHWGYNGFGNRTISSSTLDNADLVDVSSFTADAFAGIGLRFNIPQTPLAIDLGVNYQMGLMDVVKANSAPVSLSGTTDANHALVYNTINGTESKEHVRNLTESLSSIKRQLLMFSAGITLKF